MPTDGTRFENWEKKEAQNYVNNNKKSSKKEMNVKYE